jgi:hypothetical protein
VPVPSGSNDATRDVRFAPIASEIRHRSESSRCATMYGPAVRYKMDFQDNERESCINVSGL